MDAEFLRSASGALVVVSLLLAVAWQIVTLWSGSPFVADAIDALPPIVPATTIAIAIVLAFRPRMPPPLD